MLLRHGLGILGVAAAGVLLAVSATMNWQFGFSLGKTPFDGQIYGAASAAADCMKALLPFFLFAAVRNRMWSQALASALVWVVVTAFSLTSALGHAALNRLDTTGQRAIEAANHQDLRSELKRAQDQLSWVPQHRPAQTVAAELEALKGQRPWTWTKGCTVVTGKQGRDFCQQVQGLTAEHASGTEARRLETRIGALGAELRLSSGTVMADADPQAAVLTKLAAALGLGMRKEDMQTVLVVFVALLLEIGSGFGMYVAFSQWRLHDRAPAPRSSYREEAAVVAEPMAAPIVAPLPIAAPAAITIANDNPSIASGSTSSVTQPSLKPQAPETDVERFHKERIEQSDGASITATALYEEYCAWCEEQEKEPLALPTFGREFGDLGIQKAKIAGRVRYIGIKLASGNEMEEEKRAPTQASRAA